MANRNDHLLFGGIAGAGACLLAATLDQRKPSWLELLGATLSGIAAASLPDWIEPALHPNHRAFFHSVTFAGVGLPPLWATLQQTRAEQLQAAAFCEVQATCAKSQAIAEYWQGQTATHRFWAGTMLGLIPGYVSHLAADAVTPKSLPLI